MRDLNDDHVAAAVIFSGLAIALSVVAIILSIAALLT